MKNYDGSIVPHGKFYAITSDLLMLNKISSDAKLLYLLLLDKIAYSKYEDKFGSYFFLTSTNRKELLSFLDLSESKYRRLINELKNEQLIYCKQYGNGVRYYAAYHGTFIPSVLQKRISRFFKFDEPGSSKMKKPLNNKDKTINNKIISINYSNSISNTYTKFNSNQSEKNIPSLNDVRTFFDQQGYTPTADIFFYYYQEKDWKCNNQEIKNWKKLAYAWNQNQFTKLPECFYDPNTLYQYYEKLPQFVLEQVVKDQEENGEGLVRVSTLELVLSCF